MGDKTIVIPPWSRDAVVRYDPDGRRLFRDRHGLGGRFVVMYSGNHSPCHPLRTLLDAAERLSGQENIVFCFVGGGSEVATVKRFAATRRLENIRCFPYQPVEELSASLSAADLHAVVMGDDYVGIIHPCKVYNVLRLGIPFLYIGPAESYITDLVHGEGVRDAAEWAHCAGHDDVDLVVSHIRAAESAGQRRSDDERQVAARFSQQRLLSQLAAVVTESTGASGDVASER